MAGFVLVAGIFISIMSYNPSRVIQFVVMGCAIIAGILGLMIWQSSRKENTPGQYYLIIGIGLSLYGLAIGIFANELHSFLNVTSFFLILYGLTEFIFAIQTLNLKEKPRLGIMGFKIATGIIAAIGALIILTMFQENAELALLVSGIITALLGLSLAMTSKILSKV